jgi:hypothetical protein
VTAAVPDLRPLGIGEVLDVAIKIYWRNALTLFRIVLLIVAPVQIVSTLVQTSALSDLGGNSASSFGQNGKPHFTASDIWVPITGIIVAALLAGIAALLASGACFKAVADAYLEERANWRTSLRFAFTRIHSLLWVTVLAFLILIPAMIPCYIPAIWLGVSFSVAIPALLTEGVKGRHALGRSRRLVRDRWWPTFGIIVLAILLTYVISLIVGGLSGALIGGATSGSSSIGGIVIAIIGGTLSRMLTTPFTAAVLTVLYFDLRVRKEGFDLQLLAERIGLAPRPRGEFRPSPPEGAGAAVPATGDRPPFWPPPPGWQPQAAPAPPSTPPVQLRESDEAPPLLRPPDESPGA